MLDQVADALRCLNDMAIVKVGIAGRGPYIGMTEQLADHRQGFGMGGGMAGKAVPQIVKAKALQPRVHFDRLPWPVQIGAGLFGIEPGYVVLQLEEIE